MRISFASFFLSVGMKVNMFLFASKRITACEHVSIGFKKNNRLEALTNVHKNK